MKPNSLPQGNPRGKAQEALYLDGGNRRGFVASDKATARSVENRRWL